MKTVIEMAHKAGMLVATSRDSLDQLKRFAALVRADERNECAKVCEELVPDMSRTSFEAAAELRRLHEANQAMLEALGLILASDDWLEIERIARAALAKGEQS